MKPALKCTHPTTQEIIFHRPASRNLSIPPPLPGIERVKQATLLGIDVTDTLSTAAYVDRLFMQVNQRLYTSYKSYPFFNPPVYNAVRSISSSML